MSVGGPVARTFKGRMIALVVGAVVVIGMFLAILFAAIGGITR